jgi:hypothetical protein
MRAQNMTTVDTATPGQADIAAERDAWRYVLGRMTEEEEQQFEVSMLEQPEIAAHVRVTQQIRAGLLRLDERGDLDRLSMARPWTKSWRALASAAAVVFAVGIGLVLYIRQPDSIQSVIAGSPARLGYANSRTGTTASYVLAHTRGRSDVLLIRITGSEPIEIGIVPDLLDSSGKYRVTLQRQASDQFIPIGSASGLTIDANGSIPVYVNPTGLPAGRYSLLLKGQTTAEEKYRLQIER